MFEISQFFEKEPSKNMTVLIIDDDQFFQESTCKMLSSVDIACQSLSSATGLVAYLDEHPEIDLILLDIHLPEMDGYEVLLDLHLNDVRLPVITISGDDISSELSGMLGAKQSLTKPFRQDDLLDAIYRFTTPARH